MHVMKKDLQDFKDKGIKMVVQDVIKSEFPFLGKQAHAPASGSNQTTESEWKAKVKGFPEETFKDEIEGANNKIIEEVGAVDVKEKYSPGFRADKVFIFFGNDDAFKGFFIDGEQMQLKVVPYQSPDQWRETKETRLLIKTIAEIAKIERTEKSWKMLYANHTKKQVYFCRDAEVKAEFDLRVRSTSLGTESNLIQRPKWQYSKLQSEPLQNMSRRRRPAILHRLLRTNPGRGIWQLPSC